LMAQAETILVYRIGYLGDTVCALPALAALRRRFASERLLLLTHRAGRDREALLQGLLDGVLLYEPQQVGRSPAALLGLLRRLRALRPRLLVYLSHSKNTPWRLLRDRAFFRMVGIREAVGFSLPRPIGWVRQNGLWLPRYEQEVQRLLRLLGPLGVEPSEVRFPLAITARDRQKVQRLLAGSGGPLVALCPGAKFPLKRWPLERFAQLARRLREELGLSLVLLGGPAEVQAARQIAAAAEALNLAGQTTFLQSAEVLRHCRLLVANDCSAVHLAAAVGTPVVGIYSSRDYPGAWHPWGQGHRVLRDDTLPCRFCKRLRCGHMSCLRRISVEQVFEAVQEVLAT